MINFAKLLISILKTDLNMLNYKNDINDLISQYACIYEKFEKIQSNNDQIMPKGDQKTGVISEYYAKLYIENVIKPLDLKYSETNLPYDIIYSNCKVQVKSVSAFSNTRIIAPINMSKTKNNIKPFDDLYLIDLDKAFEPIGFYIIPFDNLIKQIEKYKSKKSNHSKIVGSVMKSHSKECVKQTKGSKIFCFDEYQNKVNDLRKIIGIKDI